MTVELIMSQGSRAGTTATIRPGYYLVGRHKESQIRPKSRSISRRHCLLLHNETGLQALDLKSTRGTFINGTRIESKQWQPLQDGDEIQFGKVTFRVSISDIAADTDIAADSEGDSEQDNDGEFVIPDLGADISAFSEPEPTNHQPLSKANGKPIAARQPIDHRQYKRGNKRSIRLPSFGVSFSQLTQWRVIAATMLAALMIGSLVYQIYRLEHPANVQVRQGLD